MYSTFQPCIVYLHTKHTIIFITIFGTEGGGALPNGCPAGPQYPGGAVLGPL